MLEKLKFRVELGISRGNWPWTVTSTFLSMQIFPLETWKAAKMDEFSLMFLTCTTQFCLSVTWIIQFAQVSWHGRLAALNGLQTLDYSFDVPITGPSLCQTWGTQRGHVEIREGSNEPGHFRVWTTGTGDGRAGYGKAKGDVQMIDEVSLDLRSQVVSPSEHD